MKYPEKTAEDPDGPEPADEEDIHMEYSSSWVCSSSVGSVTKNHM
jgi:hypothetical protein